MGLIDFYFINILTKIDNNNLVSVDYEYISAKCANLYSLLAILESLKKKKIIDDITSYIVIDGGIKNYTVRLRIKNIIHYVEESSILKKDRTDNDDMNQIEKIVKNILTYLSVIFKNEYKYDTNKKQIFLYKCYPVYPIYDFYSLFSEYYSTTPRLWVKKNKNSNIIGTRSRSQSSPPDLSPISYLSKNISSYDMPNNHQTKNKFMERRKRSIIGANRIYMNKNIAKSKPIEIPSKKDIKYVI